MPRKRDPEVIKAAIAARVARLELLACWTAAAFHDRDVPLPLMLIRGDTRDDVPDERGRG